MKLFIASSVSKRMENGEPAYLSGKSGIEIVREIVAETKGHELQIEAQDHFGRSREYWIGWAVAYYQWYSGRKYSDIFKVVSFEDLQKMYYILVDLSSGNALYCKLFPCDRFSEIQLYFFNGTVYNRGINKSECVKFFFGIGGKETHEQDNYI